MSEAAPTVIQQATKAPIELVKWAKKYWWAGPAIILILLGVGMAIKPAFTRWFTTTGSTTNGDKLPNAVRSVLRISGFLLPIGFILLGADYVQAACAAHGGIPCGASVGWLSHYWHELVALLSASGLAFGVHLAAPDVLDGFNENNGRSISYTPGSALNVSMFMKTKTKNATGGKNSKPLIAVNSTVAIDTTVSNLTSGNHPIQSQDLALMLSSLEITTPFHGPILDKLTGTGPNLDLVINFIGQGFGRWGDAPTLTIVVGTSPAASNDQVLTKYFTFPWAQRYLADPTLTAPWLATLDDATFSITVAESTALGAISTGAVTKGSSRIRLGTSYWKGQYWRQGLVPYWRVDAPSSNSDGLVFENFGGAGPTNTKKADKVHTLGLLSNLAGLKGNQTIDNITNIIAPDFGLEDVQNIDMLVGERLRAQWRGRIGNYDLSTGGNHVQGTPNVGMALNKLLFLLLKQASVDMQVEAMDEYTEKTKLAARLLLTAPLTTPHAFIVGSLRELDAATMTKQSLLSGGQIPNTYLQKRHHTGKA